jgi:WD40 repeat protein
MQIEILLLILPETKSDVFSVDVSQMKFNRIFYKSDDFITAIDLFPSSTRTLICCGNYSGRIFVFDYAKKTHVVENRLKLQKRKSSTSDTDIIEIPHISALAFSHDGYHLLCGLENGSLKVLDPNVLLELKSINVNHAAIKAIKFSPDSSFVTLYVSSDFLFGKLSTSLNF